MARDKGRAAAIHAGREAYLAKKSRDDVPNGYRAAPGLAAAFGEGWDLGAHEAAELNAREAAAIRIADPQVKLAEPPRSSTRHFWPGDRSLPQAYLRAAPLPCFKCRRVLLDSMSQAVAVVYTHGGFAYLRCRDCGHTWKMRIVEKTIS